MPDRPAEESGLLQRYRLLGPIASGGMATIHLGRLVGAGGFSRDVAIKRLHPQFARDPEIVAMLRDEGRFAARIRHPNVVAVLDVVEAEDDLFLVMEYVAGVPLSALLAAADERGERLPIDVTSAVIVGVLRGLHAAHEVRDEAGASMDLVHRDVSPQNILVANDGVPRVVDFGIAKAARRSQVTREGVLKGKIPYMAPEQLRAGEVDRRVDVWGAGVVLWEMLARKHAFPRDDGQAMGEILYGALKPPSRAAEGVPAVLDDAIARATARYPEKRYATAREMADEIERLVPCASPSKVGEWVDTLCGQELERRAHLAAEALATEPLRVLETSRTERDLPHASSASSASAGTAETIGTAKLAGVAIATPSRRRSRVVVIAALGAVLVGLVTSGVVASRKKTVATEESVDPSTSSHVASSVPADSAAVEAPAPGPEAPAPGASTAPHAAASATTVEAPKASAGRKGAPVRAATPGSTTPRRGARGVDERCYRLDERGIWHIKPECL